MKQHPSKYYHSKTVERKIRRSKEREHEISNKAAEACVVITKYLAPKKLHPEAINRAFAAAKVLLS